MAEKFQKFVNAPHKAMKTAAKKLWNIKTTDDAHHVKEGLLKTGSVVSWVSWFLMWASTKLALDNAALRALENLLAEMQVGKNKEGKDKALSAFAKKYPNFSSHMIYYFAMTILLGGGHVGAKYGPKIADDIKQEKLAKAEAAARRGTYGAYLDKMQSITPFLIADLIAKEGVHVDPKTGLHTPYRDSRGIWTIGFGSTKLKDGTSVGPQTKPLTSDEAYELARWHLETEETYFVMYCYDVAVDGLDIETTREALGMGSIIYNAYSKLIEDPNDKNHRERFALLRRDFKEYGYALPDSIVRARFEKYPIQNTESFGRKWLARADAQVLGDRLGNFLAGGNGIQWRRWLEAGLLTGQITPEMLMDCPVNGMYEFYKCMGRDVSAFFTGDAPNRKMNMATYRQFHKWLQNPVNENGQSLRRWKRVRDYIPDDVMALCDNQKCELGNPAFQTHQRTESVKTIEKKTYVMGYDDMYNVAMAAYRDGDFTSAAGQFENMIKMYPDNALLRNDLAATYNNLGRYNDAIAQVKYILHTIGDKKQYGAAQYNAGVAYEALGNLDRALANYKLALANGNRAAQRAITRVTNARQHRTRAFNNATINIGAQKNHNTPILQSLNYVDNSKA